MPSLLGNLNFYFVKKLNFNFDQLLDLENNVLH